MCQRSLAYAVLLLLLAEPHQVCRITANPPVLSLQGDDALDLSLRVSAISTDTIYDGNISERRPVAAAAAAVRPYVLRRTSKGTPGFTSETFIHSVP